MKAAGRVGDKAKNPSDSHGCPKCSHVVEGPATSGSGDVFINGKPALRVGDKGKHSSCCGANSWTAKGGAPAVYFNGKKVHRLGDAVSHCGGKGKLIQGSGDVFIGDVVSGGGGQSKPKGSVSLSSVLGSGGSISGLSPKGFSIQLPLNKWVIGVLAGLGALAIVALAVPQVRKFLKDAIEYLDYLVQMLFNFLANGANAVDHYQCSKAKVTPPSQPYTADDGFAGAPFNTDVTRYVSGLPALFQPNIYEDPDDQVPIDIQTLLSHSTVKVKKTNRSIGTSLSIEQYHHVLYDDDVPYAKGAENGRFYLDIDDDASRVGMEQPPAVVYARAIKRGEDLVELQYPMIRFGSYFAASGAPYRTFEHEGDGEALKLFVKRSGDSWTLQEAQMAAHFKTRRCCADCLSYDGSGHVNVYVAIGSHALAPTADPRRALPNGFKSLAIDLYDGQNQLDYTLRVLGLSVDNRIEHECVFTKRACFGDPDPTHVDGPKVGASVSEGYIEYNDVDGGPVQAANSPPNCKCNEGAS